MGLKDSIRRCIANNYSRHDVNEIISACHSLAVTALRVKAGSFKAFMIRDEKIEDLAWDFIADIFQKDSRGELIVLKEYLIRRNYISLDDADLNILLRNLVYSKIEDNIYRYYGERDPSLKKIIRNIKLAVKDRNCSHGVCYKNGFLIIDEHDRPELDIMPADFMQIKLCARLNHKLLIPDILIEIIDILENQGEYKKQFSLVALATIIRESFVLIQDESLPHRMPKIYSEILKKELDDFLGKSVVKVKGNISRHYIKRGKASEEQIDVYFRTASEIVKADFAGTCVSNSQYEQLKKHYSQLEYEQFRNKHRSLLEYIVKLVREDLIDSFRKDWIHFKQ